jgi:hypothetical protein
MPYFIQKDHPDCSGWATVKADGELLGCHMTKQDAIDQAVAVALSEGSTFDGELRELPQNYRPATAADVPEGRACGNCAFFNEEKLAEDGRAFCEQWDEYVQGGFYCNAWKPKNAYRQDGASTPAPKKDQITGSDTNPAGSASGKSGGIEISAETETALQNKVDEHNKTMREENKPEWTRTTMGAVKAVYRRGAGAFSTSHRPNMTRAQWALARVNAFLYLARTGAPENANYVTDNDLLHEDHPRFSQMRSVREVRSVDLSAPEFMRANARRGLRLYAEGKGGDGLVPQTITDARRMAAGEISEQKWRKINAWIARHLVDLEAVEDGEITAGVVAHLLWGSGATRSEALRTQAYAKRIIDQLDAEERSLEYNIHAWTHKQWLLYDALEEIAERTGKWVKDAYGDGAHYVEESPFQDEGLICANCAFYQGGQACEIVEGGIKPNAVCKFWIIPNVLITDQRLRSGEAYGGMTSNMDDDLESDEPDDLDGE